MLTCHVDITVRGFMREGERRIERERGKGSERERGMECCEVNIQGEKSLFGEHTVAAESINSNSLRIHRIHKSHLYVLAESQAICLGAV